MSLALFRFYASLWRGAGHAFRCMTLAQALQAQGWECRFVTEAESYDFVPALKGYVRIDPDDYYNNPIKSDLLVVDHYGCGIDYERHFRPYTDVIMVVDDLADRSHDCDILLDQTYARRVEEYQKDVPLGCAILVGASYALLRPEFSALRPQALDRRARIDHVDRLLVNFGGNDQGNNILATLRLLRTQGYQGAIDVVYGVTAPYKESVEAYASDMRNDITFYINPDMSRLMFDADMAIGAAGTTTWERCCLGLPTVLIETADNQRTIIQNLCRDQAVIGTGYDCFSRMGIPCDFEAGQYRDWVVKTSAVCDGGGVRHVLSVIEQKMLTVLGV